jgi:hypothetical protein
VPRLSIVIPSLAFDSDVEDTLVSVLQHRPEFSEILVVMASDYEDPYNLGREVRFLKLADCRSRIELANEGCRASRGETVHLLLPGVLAVDGWTDHVRHHFADRQVAAVAPIVMPGVPEIRSAVAGVTYRSQGERRGVRAVPGLNSQRLDGSPVLAPTLSAGFYRREVLVALDGFDGEFGEPLADVELGLALRDLELTTVVEPRSQVLVSESIPARPRSYREAFDAERLYRRHLQPGDSRSLQHAMFLGREFLLGFPRIRMVTCLAGRLAGRRAASTRAAYDLRLERARTVLLRQVRRAA